MNWNLFWGIYLFIFALACWICFYLFGIRKWKKGDRCGVRTMGKVIGSSAIHYGGIPIPLVEYVVDGKVYKVAGPKFRSGVAVRISTPFGSPEAQVETNLTTRENLPLRLKVKMQRNSFVSGYQSPLFQLYPLGSAVDVFYNPKKPKEAFVQRYEGVSKWLFILLLIVSLVLTAGGLFVIFGPRIVMS